MELIPAESYQTIYIISVAVLTIIITPYIAQFITNYNSKSVDVLLYSIALIFGIFIGVRPISFVFVDMVGTAKFFALRAQNINSIDLDMNNFIYENIPRWLNQLGLGVDEFFLILSCFYFIGTAYACKRIFGVSAIVSYMVWLASFSTFAYATNAVKAGIAATWFLLALSYWNNKKIAFPLLFITLGFHHAMVLPIIGYIICCYVKKPHYFLYFWILCMALSFLHITQLMEFFGDLLASNDDSQGAGYLLGGQEYVIKKGFRLDFVIYSAIPVIIGYWLIFKQRIKSDNYNFLFNLYCFINAIWLLCMYASFTNRIAYLSWLMYPLVLIYPFLKLNLKTNLQTEWTQRIVWGNLVFTAFMIFIYY